MYEIWLAMNIVWEIALEAWPVLLAAALLWTVLMLTAWRRPGTRWRGALPWAVGAGALVAVAMLATLPAWSLSSLTEMGYWVDWANLLAVAVGFGALVAVAAWPLAAMRLGGGTAR